MTQLFWLLSLPTTQTCPPSSSQPWGDIGWGLGGWGGRGRNALTWEEEGGQAESESPPASSGARKPHPSHRGPGVQREEPRGERSSRSRKQPGRRRRSLPAGGRSEDPGQPQPSAGAGRAGWDRRGRNPGPGPPPAQRLGRCPPQVARVMPLLLLRSSPGAGPRPLLPRRAGQGRGTHPRRARLPGAGSRPPARSHPPARLQLAGVHGRPSSEGGGTSEGGGRAARWARGPGGWARDSASRGDRAARLSARRPIGGRRVPRRAAAARSAASRRSATMWSCPGAESSRARSSPSLSLTRRAPASQPLSP